MATKKTVAIIGAGEKLEPTITKHLAEGNYRLLLFGHERDNVQQFLKEIKKTNHSAEVECAGCPYDASWEADVIILNEFDKEEITNKIKPVATQKPVINLSGQATRQELKELLPDSKIIVIDEADASKQIINILETF